MQSTRNIMQDEKEIKNDEQNDNLDNDSNDKASSHKSEFQETNNLCYIVWLQ
ncbi:11548_t:CDS:2 [Funneliformis mosseae]|uniref:11548_t:CDS:1 n=1 Tax=Funneliformis mosseae TaxID=27381 RepID=A0A9N9HHI9_FUNMO|nr:11548_t:CDS:2 [Funneliformis mosseae]